MLVAREGRHWHPLCFLNGRQIADAARLNRPDLKVLFITGNADNALVGNGHLEPDMEVTTKPIVKWLP